MIRMVAREDVEREWPAAAPWVARASAAVGGMLPVAEVATRVHDGRMQLWLAGADPATPTLYVVTELYETTAGLTCGIPIAGGTDLAGCLDDLATIEAWARAQGCARIIAEGRGGWPRALRSRGWAIISTQAGKCLNLNGGE